MKLIQGYVLALRRQGHAAFILAADGHNVRDRLHAIGERRWTAFQKKCLSSSLRTPFKKDKMPLPELDYSGKTLYLLGWCVTCACD